LPAPPGADPGPAPPDPPRSLPPQFVRRIRFTRNVFFIVGAAFLAAGLLFGPTFLAVGLSGAKGPFAILGVVFTLVFGGLGLVLALKGHRDAMATLRALQFGRAVVGAIRSVYYDTSVQINNRSPWAIEYSFVAGSRTLEGKARTWDDSARERQPGQPLHVLYLEEDPGQNTIYPPVQ
jgi:uncharacterized protein DUF3592